MQIKKKKKIILIIVILVVIGAVAGGLIWFFRSSGEGGETENSVYVDSVAMLAGLGGNGLNNRFVGVIEPQRTWEIKLPSDRKVGEIFVKEGDEVKEGDKLFTYSVEDMEESLVQAELDLDRSKTSIDQTKERIAQLKKEKAEATADAQLGFTTQISIAENDLKKQEYDVKKYEIDINKLKNSIANADVTSEMLGVVKTIKSTDSESDSYDSMSGSESDAFMTIVASGDYRVKGVVNEQNMSSIIEGQPVLVHSRVDDTIWNGTLTAVDTEKQEKDENAAYSMYGGDTSNSMTSSTNYPFYVELDSVDGLMLGQHVYIEMDYGQGEKKEGLWLDSGYIIQEEDGNAYVWAATANDKIEKRQVTLGEVDEEMQQYQITEGLTAEDYIAYPEEDIKEGDKAEKNMAQSDEEGGAGLDENMNAPQMNEEMMGGEIMNEGFSDDGMGDEEIADEDMGVDEIGMEGEE